MKIRPGIEVANLTDVGCERDNNEDYFGYCEPQTEEEFRRKGRLAIIADGMGGEEGGEVASRLAVTSVRDEYLSSRAADPHDSLLDAFRSAHDAILSTARQNAGLRSMGTTCTALAINDGYAYFAHVGDSRLYLIRNGSVLRLTHDHTAVNRLIENGVITPQEAAVHPQRHVLTGALGAKQDISADIAQAPIPLQAGDTFVLCTDGLWGQVSDSEIYSAVRNGTPSEACRQLVQLARSRGGPDNITVQILRVDGEQRGGPANGNSG